MRKEALVLVDEKSSKPLDGSTASVWPKHSVDRGPNVATFRSVESAEANAGAAASRLFTAPAQFDFGF